jgi:hypothetical protein
VDIEATALTKKPRFVSTISSQNLPTIQMFSIFSNHFLIDNVQKTVNGHPSGTEDVFIRKIATWKERFSPPWKVSVHCGWKRSYGRETACLCVQTGSYG